MPTKGRVTMDEHGRVTDARRIEFLDAHLKSVRQAMAEGVDVRGYFAWSLMDNFEWSYGYDKRFGIIRVDYDTQARIPKQSALWYRDTIGRLRGRKA